MKLTSEQFQKYKTDSRCPNCNSQSISWRDQEAGWCALECDRCKSRWTENYTLTSVDDYEPTDLNVLSPEKKLKIELEKAKAEIAHLKQKESK